MSLCLLWGESVSGYYYFVWLVPNFVRSMISEVTTFPKGLRLVKFVEVRQQLCTHVPIKSLVAGPLDADCITKVVLQ
jgi:hypothetical protein